MRAFALTGLSVAVVGFVMWHHGAPSERAGGRTVAGRSSQADAATSATRSLDAQPVADTTTVETLPVDATWQGRSARWWARRAVQARKDANKRGDTITGLRGALRARVRLGASGLEQAFLCIHRFEGPWDDTGAPYFGGVQMDWPFMAAYAPWFLRAFGPASNWTPAMQIATAERAYLSGRGFYPWPNTARRCGLL